MVNSSSGKIFSCRTVGFAQYVLTVLLGAFAKSVNETQSVVFLEYFEWWIPQGTPRHFMGHAGVLASMWSSCI